MGEWINVCTQWHCQYEYKKVSAPWKRNDRFNARARETPHRRDELLKVCVATPRRPLYIVPMHIPPEEMIGQKVVTIKTVCSIKTFGFWWYKKHEFQNTFHQPFGRYGNPDMHFLGTLKINFLILKVFWVLILNLGIIFIFRVVIWILLLVKA